jgi:hypothetical protein
MAASLRTGDHTPLFINQWQLPRMPTGCPATAVQGNEPGVVWPNAVCFSQPNKGVQPTARSLRSSLAPASGSG